jgi:rRNA maturation protein Nop10
MAEERTCSHCGEKFKPRFFLAIKLGTKRLERCPHCHKFTDVYAPPKAVEKKEHTDAPVNEEESLKRRIEDSKMEESR